AALIGPTLAATAAASEEICYELSGGQFADERYCVTSVREPQGNTKFGPENLLATGDGAWCAGTTARQTITISFKPRAQFRTLKITNGYAKWIETFRQNGRVKRAEIEADNGYKAMIEPQDTRAVQKIVIAIGRYAWLRVTVVESVRGSANPNVCLS